MNENKATMKNNKWALAITLDHWLTKYEILFRLMDNEIGFRFEKWLIKNMYKQLGDWRGMKRGAGWDIACFTYEDTLEEYENGVTSYRTDEYKWERHPVYKNIVVEYWQPDNEYLYVILRKRRKNKNERK